MGRCLNLLLPRHERLMVHGRYVRMVRLTNELITQD